MMVWQCSISVSSSFFAFYILLMLMLPFLFVNCMIFILAFMHDSLPNLFHFTLYRGLRIMLILNVEFY